MQISGGDKVEKEQPDSTSQANAPEYSKPKLRRYDQIEQVKPYGPSERKAG